MRGMPASSKRPRSSRQRYREFVEDYRKRRLHDPADLAKSNGQLGGSSKAEEETTTRGDQASRPTKRRQYLRTYFSWLWPLRFAVGVLLVLAMLVAGLEMIEPLFMRFIIDRALLNAGLDPSSCLARLNLVGAVFLLVIAVSKLIGVIKDYRQRKLNVRVMLGLRRALIERLLHLPLAKLWDMKTGGILSRLTGDVDTTTGLLQMAIVSPALSILRLLIAVGVLLTLNWRLALMAMAVLPGAMLMSFVSARRIRPIYRSVREDVEQIDGRVGETFSGIRVVRAFGRERQELLDYMTGRHTVLRKELFAHRRELLLWGSWGLLIAGVNVIIVW